MVKEQLLECVMGMYGGLDSVLDDIVYIAESGDHREIMGIHHQRWQK